MRKLFQDTEHIFRVAALFAGGLLLFLVIRAVAVPKDFGVYGHFRARALADNQNKPVVYAGHRVCEECHTDVLEAKRSGKHAGVACEACHGALAKHAEDPTELTPEKPDPRATCLVCHTANVSKPEGFPQIDVREHGEEGACTTCHTAHNPLEAPEAPAAETNS